MPTDTKLTLNGLGKMVAAAIVLIGYTVAVYSWVARMDAKIDLMRTEQNLIHATIDKRLEGLAVDAADSRRLQSELVRTLDRTTVVLEQINKQLEQRQ